MKKTTSIFLTLLLPCLFLGCNRESNNSAAPEESARGSSASLSGTTKNSKNTTPSPQKAHKRSQETAPSKDGTPTDTSPERAPDQFSVKLETTKGDIIIDITRNWAPKGADRFHELVKSGFYNDIAFFRVISGFMAQTGLSGDPGLNSAWQTKRIQDDPVKQSNTRGMVSFAMAGPNTRTTQFFINFRDNSRLDSMGFAPIGRTRDMSVVDSIYSGYGEGAPRGSGPSQGRIQSEGNPYIKQEFPNLDYIQKATILAP